MFIYYFHIFKAEILKNDILTIIVLLAMPKTSILSLKFETSAVLHPPILLVLTSRQLLFPNSSFKLQLPCYLF